MGSSGGDGGWVVMVLGDEGWRRCGPPMDTWREAREVADYLRRRVRGIVLEVCEADSEFARRNAPGPER